MATFTVRRSKHGTLSANTVDTVIFSSRPTSTEVRNLSSTATIFFREDGTAPTVAGDDTYRLAPGETLQVDAENVEPPQIQLISSGTPDYSVTAVPR
jgi:hypothetical protein